MNKILCRVLALTFLVASGAFMPTDVQALTQREDLATCNAPLKQPADAIIACRRLLADLEPAQQVRVYINIGAAFSLLGSWDSALAAYNSALALAPDFAPALGGRGTAYMGKFEFVAAIADFTTALALNKNNAGVLANRCTARAEAGIELTAALDDCNSALQLFPAGTAIYGQRALIYVRIGKFAEAISDYDTAIQSVPHVPYFLFGRGIAKHRAGDAAGGDTDIAAARAIDTAISSKFATFGLVP